MAASCPRRSRAEREDLWASGFRQTSDIEMKIRRGVGVVLLALALGAAQWLKGGWRVQYVGEVGRDIGEVGRDIGEVGDIGYIGDIGEVGEVGDIGDIGDIRDIRDIREVGAGVGREIGEVGTPDWDTLGKSALLCSLSGASVMLWAMGELSQ
jgi:hypothetical protein